MSDGETPNIIAVDDDYAVRMAMEFMFKKWPEYNLILAEDPDDALAKLEERVYMMMFSDINMPVMSGLDLLKIVKEKKPTLPVVMLTSETDIQNSITAFRYGAMDYLLKPPTIATVRGAIDKAVEYLEEEAKKSSAGIDMDDFKDMVENFSPEKMGLADSGSKSTEFTKLVNMLQEKLIHPGKIGRIHNLFLLSKSGIVIANLSAKSVEQTDVDILGGMFTAVKDFMEDAVSASTTSSLNDIQFGNFHDKFASGAYSELAVVYTGIMNQKSEDAITNTLWAFEIENSAILENWDGDLSKLEGSTKYLETLFGDIDKDKD